MKRKTVTSKTYRHILSSVLVIACVIAMFMTMAMPTVADAAIIKPMTMTRIDYSYSSSSSGSESSSFYYSDYLLLGDANVHSSGLTLASVALSMGAYSKSEISGMFTDMGYTAQYTYGSYERTLTFQDNDYVAYTIATKEFTHNGEDYIVYAVAVRGTPKNAEWFSDFDLGTGSNHSGFYNAAQDIQNHLAELVLNDGGYPATNRILWTTGHSRGAAVANIIAGSHSSAPVYFDLDNIFGYTFACPAVSKNADDSLTNIYNYNNPGDLIPVLPMEDWGYDRYGQTITLYDSDYANFSRRFNQVTGKTYIGATNTSSYENLIGGIVPNQSKYNAPTVKGAMALVAYFMSGRTSEVSPWEVLSYSGVKFAEAYIISKFSTAVNAIKFLANVDNEVATLLELSSFLSAADSELSNATDEVFKQWLINNKSKINQIKSITNISIEKIDDLASSYNSLLTSVNTMNTTVKTLGNIVCIMIDTTGNPITSISQAHEQVTYTLWINSMFNGYKGHYQDTSLESITVDTDVVGDYCFSGCTNLINADVDQCVQYIGSSAFSNCTNLESVNFEQGVEYIGAAAFYSCTSLQKIELPEGISVISDSTFEDCTSLQEVVIPNSVTSIGKMTFRNCTVLNKITLPCDVTFTYGYYDSFLDCVAIEQLVFSYGHEGMMKETIPSSIEKSLTTVTFEEGVTHIGDNYAFNGCSALETVNIPNSMTSIGKNAFNGCTSLKSIELSNNLKHIGEYAFRNAGLESVVIPDSLTDFGQGAFLDCEALQKVELPCGLTTIENSAFAGCKVLQEIEIPNGVTSIGSYAFRNCTALKKITMPCDSELVVYNGYSPFLACVSVEEIVLTYGQTGMVKNGYIPTCVHSSLKSVTFDEGITYIGSNALSNCTLLETVNLPSSLVSIGGYAFSGCTSLNTIELPEGLETIEGHAFDGSGIASIAFPNGLISIGYKAFIDCSALENIVFSNSITTIESGAFYRCESLTGKAILPESITEVSDRIFYGCTLLQEVVIPNSALKIGDDAFGGCKGLKKITMPCDATWSNTTFDNCTGVEDIVFTYGQTGVMKCSLTTDIKTSLDTVTFEEGTKHIVSDAFNGSPVLETVILPNTMKSIDYQAFCNCVSLKNIELPEGLESIGRTAFGSSGLESIILPDSIISIGAYAFSECTSISGRITIPKGMTAINDGTFSKCTSLEEVVIPDTIINLGDYSFSNCISMKKITMPCDVEYSTYPFYNCKIIQEIVFTYGRTGIHSFGLTSDSLTAVSFEEGITEINGELRDCILLESVGLPDSVTDIGNSAFYNSASLKNIKLPNSLKNIGQLAFYSSGLEAIVFPDGLTSIGQYSFYSCTALSGKIMIPDGMTIINSNVFRNCSSIEEVYIPDSVTSIEQSAFFGCSSIKRITLPCDVDINSSFSGCTAVEELVLTYGQSGEIKQLYRIRENIGKNLKIVNIENGITCIGSSSFKQCSLLKTVNLPKSLTNIKYDAFYNCTSLQEVVIPGNVESIGSSAFSGCTSLTTLTFVGNAPTIASNAFNGIVATAYYPAGDDTWTEEIRQNYGGTITWVMSGMAGDLNGDAKVNSRDLLALAKHLAGWSNPVDGLALDVNGDGKINSRDLLHLAKYLADWDVALNYGSSAQ